MLRMITITQMCGEILQHKRICRLIFCCAIVLIMWKTMKSLPTDSVGGIQGIRETLTQSQATQTTQATQAAQATQATQAGASDAVRNISIFENVMGPAFATKGLPLGPDGLFIIPAEVSHVVVDVGAHFKTEFANSLQTNTERLVIAFEPTPNTYETHQANIKHPRIILLNAAVGPELADMPFYVGVDVGCNSILRRSSDFQSPKNAHGNDVVSNCQKKGKPVMVPVFPLELMINRLPRHLAITDLKVDAQGYDLQVLRSVGRSPSTWARIKLVRCECQEVSTDEQALLLYVNQDQCPAIVAFMAEVGFKLQRRVVNNAPIKEYNLHFIPAGNAAIA